MQVGALFEKAVLKWFLIFLKFCFTCKNEIRAFRVNLCVGPYMIISFIGSFLLDFFAIVSRALSLKLMRSDESMLKILIFGGEKYANFWH